MVLFRKLVRMWDSLSDRKMKARFAALRLESFSNKHRNSSNRSAASSPFCMGVLPISSHRAFRKECVDGDSPIGEIHVAIPFAWEVTPGTPKRGGESADMEDMVQKIGSASPEKLSPQSPSSEHDFGGTTNLIAIRSHTRRPSNDAAIASADELFHYNPLLSLQLPPRLQAVKHRLQELRELRECAACYCLDAATTDSPSKQASPQSSHSKLKLQVSFCGLSKMSHTGSTGGVVIFDSGRKVSAGAKLQNLMSKLKRDESKPTVLFSDRTP